MTEHFTKAPEQQRVTKRELSKIHDDAARRLTAMSAPISVLGADGSGEHPLDEAERRTLAFFEAVVSYMKAAPNGVQWPIQRIEPDSNPAEDDYLVSG